MKHSYNPDAAHLDACPRCRKELARRNAQAQADPRRLSAARVRRLQRQPRQDRDHRPIWGSQEWAETRGDDLGESEDR